MWWNAPFSLVRSDLTLSSQQDMATRTLDGDGDLGARVRTAEQCASIADNERGSFMAFQAALTSLEGKLQDFWRILNLDPAIKEALCAMIIEQRKQCEVISLLLNNVVSRYDRLLNLVLRLLFQ